MRDSDSDTVSVIDDNELEGLGLNQSSGLDPCPEGFRLGTSGRCEIGSSSAVPKQPVNLERYTNATLGVTLEYLSDWNIPPSYIAPFYDKVFYQGDPLVGLGIKTVSVLSMSILDEIYRPTYALLPHILPNYRSIDSGQTTLLGMTAYQIKFTTSSYPDITTEVGTIFILIEGKLYGLVYFADGKAFLANSYKVERMITH